MDLLNEHIPYYLHSMFDMIGEENFLKICKMYRESSIYIIVQTKKDTINRERKIFCAYENKYSFMAMIKILNQCQEGVFL